MIDDSQKLILLVEDDESIAELERRTLMRAGYTVHAVTSVAQGMSFLQQNNCLAVLLDYQLPDGDPWSIVEVAKTHIPPIPVIIVTCMGIECVALEAMRRGVADYVKKDSNFRDTLIIAIERIVRLKKTEEQLFESIREKEFLLKEEYDLVNHSFQILQSILSISARLIPKGQAQSALFETQHRIHAIALIHEFHQSMKSGSFPFLEYIKTMFGYLHKASGRLEDNIELIVNVNGFNLNLDRVIRLGLILTELMLNALKHAFPDGRSGQLKIDMLSSGGTGFQFVVSDNGIGLPAEFNVARIPSIGLRLAENLANQMGGQLKSDSKEGAVFSVYLPN